MIKFLYYHIIKVEIYYVVILACGYVDGRKHHEVDISDLEMPFTDDMLACGFGIAVNMS